MKNTRYSVLIIVVSLFIMVFGNATFFTHVLEDYPANTGNAVFLASLFVVFSGFTILLLSLVCYKYTIKPLLILTLLLSSLAAYFMDSYNIIIDDDMIDNIIKTDFHESVDLLSVGQAMYFVLLGVIPSIFVYKTTFIQVSLSQTIISRLKLIAITAVITVGTILLLSDYYASFFREHKILRSYSNPSYYIYSAGKYIGLQFKNKSTPLQKIGLDAKKVDLANRQLMILVVGETVRADHMSLNGYAKQTNPSLAKQDTVNFTDVSSCGTSTAVSVPCMFAVYGRSDFSKSKANSTENLLDILQRAGTNVIWLDNNSDSKGVALRVPYESYKNPDKNSICDPECRDMGLLTNLQSYIDSHPQGDILIVLHQMGNHGPAYYKRYPKEFEKFTPTCKTPQLEQCSDEEINNAYDNTVLYTDYFLSKVIELLQNNQQQLATSMFYISDHGESLGESNVYLHGLPYMIAPKEQTHVPMIMWLSETLKSRQPEKYAALKSNANKEQSHDNIFHTVLGLMGIQTSVYDEELDLSHP